VFGRNAQDILSPTKALSYYETNTGKGLFTKALGIQVPCSSALTSRSPLCSGFCVVLAVWQRSILLQPFQAYDYGQ
jgi:hypothetical protein